VSLTLTLTKERCEELYRQHAPAAFRRAERMLGSVSDADEVVHDVFLRLFEQPGQFLGMSGISTYLYSAVTHECLNRIRNRRTRTRLGEQRAQLEPTSDPGTQAEASLVARDLLAALPEPLATVAVYYHLDELSHREIGAILGCSHSHVGHLLAKLERWVADREKAACQS
jgi:RNA polymerase sigma-70 factor (ECF subfamily)